MSGTWLVWWVSSAMAAPSRCWPRGGSGLSSGTGVAATRGVTSGQSSGGRGVARVRTGVTLGAVASRAVSGGPSFHRVVGEDQGRLDKGVGGQAAAPGVVEEVG